jgi:hypothetical protein
MRPKKKGFLLNLVLAREYHHRVLVLPIVMTMMNIYRLLISFLAFVVAVVAIPFPSPGGLAAAECKAVSDIVDILKVVKVTPFRASFLHVPASTSSSTASVYCFHGDSKSRRSHEYTG